MRIAFGFLKRVFHLWSVVPSDYIFIHREVTPVGPPLFEWIIAKVLRKKIIYDFDDAIWLTDKINESKLEKTIRYRNKVSSICRWSYKVSCGNHYLASYAKQFNSSVVINPTTIDTLHKHNKQLPEVTLKHSKGEHVIIGWTGSHSTLKYLKSIEPVLQQLESKFNQVRFLVIADEQPRLALQKLDFIQWNKATEVADLTRIDIGIMPLPDDEWAKGKCGFKALQYMAMGIPCVVSPVGVNTTIVNNGITGYWATSTVEWFRHLESLILTLTLRKTIGVEGRKFVEEHYSLASNSSNFLSLFE
jgi:glycosyltransferase involved in cell wall biosynthesis